jgi:peptide/nickel transport system permease protein
MAREMTAHSGVALGEPALGQVPVATPLSPRQRLLRLPARKPLGAFGALIIAAMAVATVGAPVVARYDPVQSFSVPNPTYDPNSTALYTTDRNETVLDAKSAPSMKHWLGTDDAGRDIWSRIIWGTRRSLGIGVAALFIAVGVGSFLGVVSGYFGGVTDTVLQRLLDALQAFPALLIVILAASAFELNLRNLVLVLGFVGIAQVSRLMRAKVLSLREMPFIEAGRVLGASHLRLMFRHILPNTFATVIVVYTIGLGTVILAEASLSFLGLTPPGVSWGAMLNAGRNFMYSSPWQAIFSGLAITLAVLAFNLVGDALRDILDPRLRV